MMELSASEPEPMLELAGHERRVGDEQYRAALPLINISNEVDDRLRVMAGIKQNGILGRPLRDSWLASAEHLA